MIVAAEIRTQAGAREDNGVRVVHAVSGRARLLIPELRGSAPLAGRFESSLRGRGGIYRAYADVRTGSLLLLFDPERDVDSVVRLVTRLVPHSPPHHHSRPARSRSLVRRGGGRGNSASTAMQSAASGPDAAKSTAPGWYCGTSAAALEATQSSAAGLRGTEAAERLARIGRNVLPAPARRTDFEMLIAQFLSAPVLLLAGSAAVTLATGGLADAVAIGAVLAINAAIGFVTEKKAEKTLHDLNRLRPEDVNVLRDGVRATVASADLVPGDVVLLAHGARVPADARLLSALALTVDEAALTGESRPVPKRADVDLPLDTPIAARRNMLYLGTRIVGGSARAVVVATGSRTEMGGIQALAAGAAAPETPMQKQLRGMSRQLVLASGAVCGGVFFIGLLRGYGLIEMLKTATSLAVAALPEGLPTVATTTLALGIQRMRRHNVLVRKLGAIEALGAVQVLCLDKTGTLTMNRVAVVEAHLGGQPFAVASGRLSSADGTFPALERGDSQRLVETLALCSEVRGLGLAAADDDSRASGSPTEHALLEMALQAGVDTAALRRRYRWLKTQHRSERTPYVAAVHAGPAGRLVAVKGSPSVVLDLCDRYLRDGETAPLGGRERTRIEQANELLAARALRVLGVAFKESETDTLEDLVWIGLVGMTDPLRRGMKALIGRFRDAGIASVIVTGDQRPTAQAIARELELNHGAPLEIVDARGLEKIDDLVPRAHVFARVSPAEKLRIVRAFQRSGRVVAMTGDGINDGPALRAADVGVAMGGHGTEAARDLADIVVADDNLHSLLQAVEEGRTIYGNVRKSLHYLLATNLSEIWVMLGAVAFGLGRPLSPLQLLWLNLVTDVFPALALALEPPEADVMKQPPRDSREPIVRREDYRRIGFESVLIAGTTLGSYGYAILRYGRGPRAGAQAFLTLVLAQLAHALGCRSEKTSLLGRKTIRRRNRWLEATLLGSLGLQGAAALVPGLRSILGLSRLGPLDYLVVGAGAALPLLLTELRKPHLRPERAANGHGAAANGHGAAGNVTEPVQGCVAGSADSRRLD
jgi:Ca2+-transporting ATPase